MLRYGNCVEEFNLSYLHGGFCAGSTSARSALSTPVSYGVYSGLVVSRIEVSYLVCLTYLPLGIIITDCCIVVLISNHPCTRNSKIKLILSKAYKTAGQGVARSVFIGCCAFFMTWDWVNITTVLSTRNWMFGKLVYNETIDATTHEDRFRQPQIHPRI